MKLITWNTAARKGKAPHQCAAIEKMAPDVLALQEVTKQTLPLWQEMLPRKGDMEKLFETDLITATEKSVHVRPEIDIKLPTLG